MRVLERRPQLAAALNAARKRKGSVVVAKLARSFFERALMLDPCSVEALVGRAVVDCGATMKLRVQRQSG